MSYTLSDVGVAFTCCLFPEFTRRAVESLLRFYPGLERRVIIDDHCREQEQALLDLESDLNIPVLRNPEQVGAGYSLDRGFQFLATSPLILTVEHGIEFTQPGLLEFFLKELQATPKAIGVGRKRANNRCTKAFGPYIDPLLALWDGDFIRAHEELSFKLTTIQIGDWAVPGCSTAQFLQYRAQRLGHPPRFVDPPGGYRAYFVHHRTPQGRGCGASPHELVVVDEDYLCSRRRKRDGSLVYLGN